MPTLREAIETGRKIHERLERTRHHLEAGAPAGLGADRAPLPTAPAVDARELPEWYLGSFRAVLAACGKGSAGLRQWNEYLRSAREARPDLDLNDPLAVVRAGAEDLAGALDVLRRIEAGTSGRARARLTITVGPAPP